MRVDLYEVQSGKLSRAIPIGAGQTHSPGRVAWSADSRKLALHGIASPIILCDITKGRPIALINTSFAGPVVFSGQDRVLLAVGSDARIHRWDLTGLNR